MPSDASRARDAGVTLVEMLVALAVFALVGLAGFGILDAIVRVRDRTEGRLEAHAALDRALAVWSRDLESSLPGGLALAGGELSFARSLDGRATAFRYRLAEGALLRAAEGRDQRLLDAVEGLAVRVLDGDGTWRAEWPPAEEADAEPRAVELRLDVSLAGAGPVAVLRLAELPRGAGG